MRFFSILTLSIALSPVACVIVDGGTDDVADDDGNTTDTTDGGGVCMDSMTLDPVLSYTIDGNSSADLTATCSVAAANVGDGVMNLELDCLDGDDVAHAVLLTAPAVAAPSLEVGASGLSLTTERDGTDEISSGPTFELADDLGLLVGEVVWAYGPETLGPASVHYASHCPADPEDLSTGSGFVDTTTLGGDHYEVFVGEPQTISDGDLQWELIATDTQDVCCHGALYSAALIRH